MRENLDPILTDPDFLALPPEQDFLSQFRTMDTVPEEEAQWLVPGYIPQGQITLLAADGGVGKTSFWCQLLAALSTGRATLLEDVSPKWDSDSLSGKADTPAETLSAKQDTPHKERWGAFFSTEDSVRKKLKKKLRLAGAKMMNLITLESSSAALLELRLGSPELSDFIHSYRPALCVLDPIQGFLPHGVNMAARNEIREHIFTRDKHRLVGLSQQGKILYAIMLDILEKYEELENELRQLGTEPSLIKFGAIASTPQILFPGLFIDFESTHPNIHIEIIEDGGVNILHDFLQKKFDFALLVNPFELPPDLADVRLVAEDEIVAFLPLGHPLTSKAILTWEDLAEYPLVSLSDKYQTYFKVMEQFRIRGLEPHFAYTSSSWQYLTDAIQRNFVITLMPSLVPTFSSTDNIIIKRIKNPASFNLFLARLNKKHYSKENKLFYDFLNQHLPKLK